MKRAIAMFYNVFLLGMMLILSNCTAYQQYMKHRMSLDIDKENEKITQSFHTKKLNKRPRKKTPSILSSMENTMVDDNYKLVVASQAKKLLQQDKFKGDPNILYFFTTDGNYDIAYQVYQDSFRYFYDNFYTKHRTCREDVIKAVAVEGNNRRSIALKGQHKVIAKKKIEPHTILGIYTGILLLNNHGNNLNEDWQRELDWLQQKNLVKNIEDGIDKINKYAFDIKFSTFSLNTDNKREKSLCLSSYGRGNLLRKVNAHWDYRPNVTTCEPNVKANQGRYGDGPPLILFYVKEKPIRKGSEIVIDYGEGYWKNKVKEVKQCVEEEITIDQSINEIKDKKNSRKRKHCKIN